MRAVFNVAPNPLNRYKNNLLIFNEEVPHNIKEKQNAPTTIKISTNFKAS
jgi:hypothetical protein